MWCSIVKRVYPLVHELLKIIKKWNILVNNNSHKHFWNGFVNIKSNILVEHDAIPEIAKCILDIHSNEGHTVLLGVEDFFPAHPASAFTVGTRRTVLPLHVNC